MVLEEHVGDQEPVAGRGERVVVELAVGGSLGEPLGRIDNVRRAGETPGRELSGEQSARCRRPGMEGLRHRPEASFETRRVRSRERDCGAPALVVEPEEVGAGNGRADGSNRTRRVPADAVVLVADVEPEAGGRFDSGDERRQQRLAVDVAAFRER